MGYSRTKAVDLNGDGRLDAVSVMRTHINWNPYGFLTVALNTGNDPNGVPQFSTVHNYLPAWDVRSFTAGDLNGDGIDDFITGFAYGQLQVYLSNGDGSLTQGQATGISFFGAAVAGGTIADVNGDGNADFIVTTGQGTGATDIFFGNGDGTLQAPVVLTSDSATIVAAADVNNDGSLDIVRGFGNGSVSVSLNTGTGSFGSPTSFTTVASGGVNGFFISDVDGDGNLDAALSLYWAGQVVIVLGNGDGTFGASYSYGGIPNAIDVTLADFTGDGKPEIASVSAAGYGGQTFRVLTNTTPAPAPTLPTQTLTLLGGVGNAGDFAQNTEFFNPTTGEWQPAYLVEKSPTQVHDWGVLPGTTRWINYIPSIISDSDVSTDQNNPDWYLYRVRFNVQADAVNPTMSFSVKADNFAAIDINGVSTGAVIEGQANGINADALFSQNVVPGENTITIDVGDYGGLNGFNYRIDLTVESAEPLEVIEPEPTDTTSPVITVPDDIIAEATSAAGATVSYAAATATDAVGVDSITYSAASGSTFALGTTTVVVEAADAAGNSSSGSFDVTVEDTTAPEIASVAPSITTIWPPNKKMIPVSVTVDAADAVGVVYTRIVSVSSNQTDRRTQWEITGPLTVNLLANRNGKEGARIYTITVEVTDGAGNTTTATCAVTVPHDQGKSGK